MRNLQVAQGMADILREICELLDEPNDDAAPAGAAAPEAGVGSEANASRQSRSTLNACNAATGLPSASESLGEREGGAALEPDTNRDPDPDPEADPASRAALPSGAGCGQQSAGMAAGNTITPASKAAAPPATGAAQHNTQVGAGGRGAQPSDDGAVEVIGRLRPVQTEVDAGQTSAARGGPPPAESAPTGSNGSGGPLEGYFGGPADASDGHERAAAPPGGPHAGTDSDGSLAGSLVGFEADALGEHERAVAAAAASVLDASRGAVCAAARLLLRGPALDAGALDAWESAVWHARQLATAANDLGAGAAQAQGAVARAHSLVACVNTQR